MLSSHRRRDLLPFRRELCLASHCNLGSCTPRNILPSLPSTRLPPCGPRSPPVALDPSASLPSCARGLFSPRSPQHLAEWMRWEQNTPGSRGLLPAAPSTPKCRPEGYQGIPPPSSTAETQLFFRRNAAAVSSTVQQFQREGARHHNEQCGSLVVADRLVADLYCASAQMPLGSGPHCGSYCPHK